jgi:hypothetical protein
MIPRNEYVRRRGRHESVLAASLLEDDTLRSMRPVLDLEQFRQLLTRLAGLDAEELRAIASADPELAKSSELADLIDDGHNAANTSGLRYGRTPTGCVSNPVSRNSSLHSKRSS